MNKIPEITTAPLTSECGRENARYRAILEVLDSATPLDAQRVRDSLEEVAKWFERGGGTLPISQVDAENARLTADQSRFDWLLALICHHGSMGVACMEWTILPDEDGEIGERSDMVLDRVAIDRERQREIELGPKGFSAHMDARREAQDKEENEERDTLRARVAELEKENNSLKQG